MSSMGEYGSLLQLGFGTGAGLSVFQAPLEVKYKKLNASIDSQLAMTEKSLTEKGKRMNASLSSLKLRLLGEYQSLVKWQRPFLILSVCGAFANWAALIYVSMYANEPVTDRECYAIIAGSVVYYLVIGGFLAILAQIRLRNFAKELSDIENAV